MRRPGERAADVPEQLGLDQPRTERRGADRQERAAPSRAVTVDGPGDELLAGAALAGDQHRGVRRRDEGDLLEELLHGRRPANHRGSGGFSASGLPRRRRLAEIRRMPAPSRLECTVDDRRGLIEVEGLHQVIESPSFHGPDGGLEITERGHDDDRRRADDFPELAQCRQAVHPRQAHVEHDGIEDATPGDPQSLLGRGGELDLVAELAQEVAECPADTRLVINDQDATHGFRPASPFEEFKGRLSRNRVHAPSRAQLKDP